MSKMIVIADDFTGSNDTGVQMANKGAKVTVALTKVLLNCDIPVINTDSRALDAETAGKIVTQAVIDYIDPDTKIIFKKIDSTFRGNVGIEVKSAADAFDADLVVVASAIPKAGRTTIQGRVYVNSVDLVDTEFASDPKTPVESSTIAEILGATANLAYTNVTLETLRDTDVSAIFAQMDALPRKQVVIFDSETDDDLAKVAKVLAMVNKRMVLVGAAGIASHLCTDMFMTTKKPMLIIAGSLSEVTQNQVVYCEGKGIKVIDVEPKFIIESRSDYLSTCINQVAECLSAGQDTIVRTSRSQEDRVNAARYASDIGITGIELGDLVSNFLGEFSQEVIRQDLISSALFTGGDIATGVAIKMGISGYQIEGEIEPCIPYGKFVGHDISVATKAGGFGKENSIANIIQFFKTN